MWPIIITLQGPPRGKGAGRAAVTGNGQAHVYTDSKTRKYESQLRFAAQQQMGDAKPTAQPIAVAIEARIPVPSSWSQKKRAAALAGRVLPTTRPDVENYSKAMDALNGIVWVDDKQIVDEHIAKIYSERPGLTIRIMTVVPPPLPVQPSPRASQAERFVRRQQTDLFA